jgi:predicted RNA methylase
MQTKGLTRNTIDKYYTAPNITELCVQHINNNISINKETDVVIEPSAGNGAFIPAIMTLSNNCIFYDLEPEHNNITRKDYLLWNHDEIAGRFKKIHVVGNPPFGRQSSMAIKFIKKSCVFCDSVSFILPKSFKKDSLKKTFPPHFHLIFEYDLPYNSFLVNGKHHDVPCVFQIWEKKQYNRERIEKCIPVNFMFVKKDEQPDISFRRVGVNAGKIDVNIDEKSCQSHYFIKFTNGKTIDDNIIALSSITFDFNNMVVPKSKSKQELILQFNPLL